MKMDPRHSMTATAALAATIALAMSQPSAAQDAQAADAQQGLSKDNLKDLKGRDDFSDYVESTLSKMEAARRRDECEGLQRLKQTLGTALAFAEAAKAFPPETIANWRRRSNMILQRPCPPSNAGPPIESVLEDIGPRPVIVDRPESQPDEPENIPPESSGGQDVENVLDDIEPVRPGEPARPAEEAPQPIYAPVLFEGWDRLAEILFGFREVEIPPAGIGVMRDGFVEGPDGESEGAEESFAGETEESVATMSLDASARFGRFGIGLSYAEGDASNSFAIPADSGVDSGIVYGAPAPSGSSGIITPFGLTGGTEVELKSYGIEADFSLNKRFSDGWMAASGLQLNDWSLYAGFERIERDYDGFASYSGTAPGGFVFEFSQDRRQEIDESYYRVGTAIGVAVPLGGRWIGHFDALAGGYYRDSNLESVERNMSNFGPMADRDFVNEVEDSEDGFGFEGEAGAALEFRLSPRFSIFAGGSARYLSDVGAIFNPNSGDQVFFDGLTTTLQTEDMWSYQGKAGIVIRFGGR